MIEIKDKIIYLPEDISTLPDLSFLLNGVHYGFPNAKLAIDGSLFKKQINRSEGTVFMDRKGHSSINGMFIFSAKGNIRNAYINKPGSCHDQRVFRDSYFYNNIDSILRRKYYLLADGGYEKSRSVLIPYSSKELGNDPLGKKLLYNKLQSSARMTAECGLGLLKNRMKPLLLGLQFSEADKCVRYINASVVLHQLLLNIEDSFIIEDVYNEYNCISESLVDENDGNTVKNIIAEHLYNTFTYYYFI